MSYLYPYKWLMLVTVLLLLAATCLMAGCSAERIEMEQPEIRVEYNDDEVKVVVLNIHAAAMADLFYIRAPLNQNRDIILLYYQNSNGGVSPRNVFVGEKSLTDEELMNAAHLVIDQHDSTGPLSGSQTWWCLFAQHGYAVPVVDNPAGLTTTHVGTLWQDQYGRRFTIGNVTESSIILLPQIYKDEDGHDRRGWNGPFSYPITRLRYAGSSSVRPAEFVPTSYSVTQLCPIMRTEDRRFTLDGQPVTTPGTYLGRNFSVSEQQVGYDPATVARWFPTPALEEAEPMARFTWNYDFCGIQCSVHTTMQLLRPVEFQRYCPTQQQTFVDRGSYKAMFLIPNAAPQEGIEFDKPFPSPSLAGSDINFYRNDQSLKDVDRMIDRLVAYLYDEAADDYLLGLSAGLSLISGDTRPEVRRQNILLGDADAAYRLCALSPSNYNKFYVSAVNASPYVAKGNYFPVPYTTEIDYYVSFFNPAENDGQAYWYRDGDRYVIYSHCQEARPILEVRVPAFMDGCALQVVEQTDGARLLSETVHDGTFLVSYATDEANYIVVTAKQ